MSELIDNREHRKEAIMQILADLHAGKSLEEVKKTFAAAFAGVSALEISEAENALIKEGLPVEEVQKLCDVHAAVFKGSIEEIHKPVEAAEIPGHPVNVLKQENRYLEGLLHLVKSSIPGLPQVEAMEALKGALAALARIDVHYARKENLFFPFLEKYGITAPPKVMWGVDDEIRRELKEVRGILAENPPGASLVDRLERLTEKIAEMIYKEEKILLPMLLETLSEDEWREIAGESVEMGYLVEDVPLWNPGVEERKEIEREGAAPGVIPLPSGALAQEELIALLNTLPFDLTFVDKEDRVKYFSEGKERLFSRARTVIGRQVSNCHPPASVAVVEQIVSDFRSGKKDQEDFWLKRGDQFILIRYYAVRSPEGKYLGVLEVTQDIKPIQEIKGEKRLLS